MLIAVVSVGWTCVSATFIAPLADVRQVARMLRIEATCGLSGARTSLTFVRAKWVV